MNIIKLLKIKLLLLFIIIVFGCAVTITKEAAQQSIDDAYSAIDLARFSPNADASSLENLRKAERLLSDAEDALRRNRRQRAYTLANRSIELAKLAQGEVAQDLDEYSYDTGAQVNDKMLPLSDETNVIEEDIPVPKPVENEPAKIMTKASKKPPASNVISQKPGSSDIPIRDTLIPEEKLLIGPEVSASDVQNRIKAAIQALEEAQKAVQSARLLMFKTQTEIGLSSANTTVKQARENGAPLDVVNMIQSRYDQARKVAAEGNYEAAAMLIEQAQTYAHAFLTPVEPDE